MVAQSMPYALVLWTMVMVTISWTCSDLTTQDCLIFQEIKIVLYDSQGIY